MKTSNILLITAFALILLGITSFIGYFKTQIGQNCVEGEGPVVQKEINPGHFKSILLNNNLNVELTQDSMQKVIIQAEENLINNFSFVVKDSQLKISRLYCMRKSKNVLIKIYTNDLEKIKIQSGGKITTSNTLIGNKLDIDANSGSNFEIDLDYKEVYPNLSAGAIGKISGNTDQLNSEISAGSNLNASKLLIVDCTISASSGAFAEVNVSGTLSASASSGASIRYSGNPTKKIENASSGGNIVSISK